MKVASRIRSGKPPDAAMRPVRETGRLPHGKVLGDRIAVMKGDLLAFHRGPSGAERDMSIPTGGRTGPSCVHVGRWREDGAGPPPLRGNLYPRLGRCRVR